MVLNAATLWCSSSHCGDLPPTIKFHLLEDRGPVCHSSPGEQQAVVITCTLHGCFLLLHRTLDPCYRKGNWNPSTFCLLLHKFWGLSAFISAEQALFVSLWYQERNTWPHVHYASTQPPSYPLVLIFIYLELNKTNKVACSPGYDHSAPESQAWCSPRASAYSEPLYILVLVILSPWFYYASAGSKPVV